MNCPLNEKPKTHEKCVDGQQVTVLDEDISMAEFERICPMLVEQQFLRTQLTAALKREDKLMDALKRVIGDHNVPSECYSTGPNYGDGRDLTCPSCDGLALLTENEKDRK